MNEQEVKNRIKIINQQLILIQRFPNYFERLLGKKGIEEYIDNRLDELILRRNQLKEYE